MMPIHDLLGFRTVRGALSTAAFVFALVSLQFSQAHRAAGQTITAIAVNKEGDKTLGWSFSNGQEFNGGAKGGLEVDESVTRGGKPSIKLTGDFTESGLYVAATARTPAVDIREISLWIKGCDNERLTLRLCDSVKRWHQFHLRTRNAPGEWQQVVLPLEQYFANQGKSGAVDSVLKYEAFGGGAQAFRNDGKWTGPVTAVSISLNSGKQKVIRTLWINDVAIIPTAPGKAETTSASAGGAGEKAAPSVQAFAEGFEKAPATAKLPEGWSAEGAVSVESGEKFRGARSLVLSKFEGTLRDKAIATSPSFPVQSGRLELRYATRSNLTSMDNSYNGKIELEYLTAEGKPLRRQELIVRYKEGPWKAGTAQLEVPDNAAAARFLVSINKETPGTFWVDELSARMVADTRQDDGLRRMIFTTVQVGNLLLPEDSREVDVEIWTTKPLQDKQLQVAFTVRDYWGAEQAAAIPATLKEAGKAKSAKEGEFLKYETKISLAGVPLEVGRYYELQGEIPREGEEPFANYTAFAILPEAPANKFPADQIPFTARTWDPTFKEMPPLTHRLGIRICGVRGGMNADPEKTVAPQIDLVKELNMGFLTNSPAQGIEARRPGWQELTEEKLRTAVQNFVKKFGHVKPMIVNLGNEPHTKGEEVKIDVNAYRIIYTELKKLDPSIFVVGTSSGLQEEYFKYGFGEWLDAYDFHSYEDPEGVRTTVSQKYPAMFAKYGHAKPVWSTELGMNSQGMTRQAVAALVYKKFANFFAGGGANCSWFGLFYPDPDARIHDSFASAHNVFDCRYNKYAPKLDAIAYYNIVNGIAIKKFVTDKVYDNDTNVFLFRDKDNRALLIAYKQKGRRDVFLPLPGVRNVEAIRIDGTRNTLSANDKGISLTISEDPVLLLYEGGVATLPDKLEPAHVRVTAVPETIVRGAGTTITAKLNGVPADRLELKVPPFWKVTSTTAKAADGSEEVRFALDVPMESAVREADMALLVKDHAGAVNGLFSIRPNVTGMISMDVLPIPFGQPEGPGVRVTITNNSATAQTLTWNAVVTGEQTLKSGKFTDVGSTDVAFSKASSEGIEAAPKSSTEVLLPLADVNPLAVYQVKVTARDSAGRLLVVERPVAGFVGVPKASGPIALDAKLSEDAWQKAPVQTLTTADEFFAIRVKPGESPRWTGPDDLSAKIRYIWDEQYLYVGVELKDDIFGKLLTGSKMWMQDGLQFLVDPARTSKHKPGKYDYCLGLGINGPETFCSLSADAGAPAGDSPDIRVTVKLSDKPDQAPVPGASGNVTYEVAIPWSRLAPFRPAPGRNLGFTLIVNEDDGNGRDSFMTWFGNAHNKDIDTVGDLILLK
ncbi:hypothetical protein DB346_10930 [Verrucomicrobia bacterium LW23]|nr:hypothetical protein DB346_10930 [Verrucomicrobia bacterium LW23]